MRSSFSIFGILVAFVLGTAACRSTTEPPYHHAVTPDTAASKDTTPAPKYSIAILPHEQSVAAVDTVQFSASAFSLPVVYTWDFGDGTSFTSPQPAAKHYYAEDGTYRVCISAASNGRVLARDTSWVTVRYPSTNSAELCQRFFVTSSMIYDGQTQYSLTQPIKNEQDYSFSITGTTFASKLDHHVTRSSAIGLFDTTAKHRIIGTLSSDGRYLLQTQTAAFDSSYAWLPPSRSFNYSRQEYRADLVSYAGDSLRLIRISCDSLIFEGNRTIPATRNHYERDADTSSCATSVPFPISLTTPCGHIRIVFWRGK